MAAASFIITLAEDVIDTELLMTEGVLLVLIWTTGVWIIWSCGFSACLSVSRALILSLTAVGGSLL